MRLVKKIRSLHLLVLLTGTVFFLTTSKALAYYFSKGYNIYSVDYRIADTGSEPIFQTAAKNWTSAVGTTFFETELSNNPVYLRDLPYSWYGQYSPKGDDNGRTFRFQISVNTLSLRERYGNTINPIISTATHEFGHVQFLSDLGREWGNLSIMSYGRDRRIITQPQPHDIMEIQFYR